MMIESTSTFFTMVIVAARAVTVLPEWKGRLVPQLCQHGFGLSEVGRVKALCEPVVYLLQQLSGCCSLPLTLPEPRQAQRGAQLQHLSLLATGHVQRLQKTAFHLAHIWTRKLEQ